MKNTCTIKIPIASLSSHKSILLIDDNPHRLNRLSAWLEMVNFSVSLATSATESLTLARQSGFDLILINLHPISYDGVELCRQLRDVNHRTPVLLYSGEAQNAETQADWRLTLEQEKGLLPACA
jgi:DNA-binding response OmpR family regulator